MISAIIFVGSFIAIALFNISFSLSDIVIELKKSNFVETSGVPKEDNEKM